MTKKDKELLLKDLCARLPYDVKVNVIYSNENASSFRQRVCVEGDNKLTTDIIGLYQHDEIDIRPYLFPLSSMTEEQKEELKDLISQETNILIEQLKNDDCDIDCGKYHFHSTLELEWILKNHFDYRGLIEKGLAIDATGLNIY